VDLVLGFQELLQGLSGMMTAPSFASFCTVVSGWVFSGRGIVTRMIVAAGSGATKHFSSYHRVFSTAAWSLDPMGLAVFTMIRRFHVVADSAYGGQNVLARLPGNCDLTSRLLLAARLYEAKPERLPGTNGRPRKRGQRVANPADMLQGRCRRIALCIYGRSYRSRIADQVIRWYAMRWSIEVTFRDSKQCLGFEDPQGWSRKAVERTAPLAMLLHTLVVLWFATDGHRLWRPPTHRWYPAKVAPSFADMLGTLRRGSVRQHVLAMAPRGLGSRKLARLLENAISMAA
jgi:hypothetical protein